MQPLFKSGLIPVGLPLLADDVEEFHASRLLLLCYVCGTSGTLEGLTKMAKLDFFVRYPAFFNKACTTLGKETSPGGSQEVESNMVRFHYGPWDKRYYRILSYLRSRNLIAVSRKGNAINISLTEQGLDICKAIQKDQAFADLISQMRRVKKAFGSWKGVSLMKLVYQVFSKEVADRKMGQYIQ